MIALDTNILVYADRADLPQHLRARKLLDEIVAIAALCLEHHAAELWTADRDFARFPELRARNPLAE